MKNLLLIVLITILSNSVASAKNILPSTWTEHIFGIEIQEKDLGVYQGDMIVEGANFFSFKKEITNKSGSHILCEYIVHKEKLYIGFPFCNEIPEI